ncbi:MAG TPA: LCP family protein, partial [Cellulomonas sp.]
SAAAGAQDVPLPRQWATPPGSPPATAPRARPAAVAPRRSAPSTRTASAATPPPGRPARPAGPTPPAGATPRRTHRVRATVVVLVVLLVLALAWPVGLAVWANGKIQHTAALSGAAATPGTTYLLAGSDARGDGGIADDGTVGARTDTILLLHVPEHGPTALISLPRDTYVHIDGHGPGKLNAAFTYGGAPLLVHTVEQLTGLTIDHYAEIGLGGVKDVVDAVGGVNLCYDHDVNDADSGMVWTAGCHDVDGTQALAFSRMRKADPEGDIGREKRQRQLIGAVLGKVDVKRLVWHPSEQVSLVNAGTGALTLEQGASIRTLASLAMAFRAANGAGGVTGTPPIKSLDYRPGGVGSTVLLDPDQSPTFWAQVRDGQLPPGKVGGIPG